MTLSAKRYFKLWLGWTMLMFALIGGFWGIWYAISGSVPHVQTLCATIDATDGGRQPLPFSISRGWDIAMVPFVAAYLIAIVMFMSKLNSLFYNQAIMVHTVSGILALFITPFVPAAAIVFTTVCAVAWVAHGLIQRYEGTDSELTATWSDRAKSIAAIAFTNGIIGGITLNGLPLGFAFGIVASITMPIAAFITYKTITVIIGTIALIGRCVVWASGSAMGKSGISGLLENTANLREELVKDHMREYISNHYPQINGEYLTKRKILEAEDDTGSRLVDEVIKEFTDRDCMLEYVYGEGLHRKA